MWQGHLLRLPIIAIANDIIKNLEMYKLIVDFAHVKCKTHSFLRV